MHLFSSLRQNRCLRVSRVIFVISVILALFQLLTQPQGTSRGRPVSVIKIKSAPHRWPVPAAHASGEWLFGCIEPRWIAIDNSM